MGELFVNNISSKGSISKICKELTHKKNNNKKKIIILSKKGQRTERDIFPKTTYRWPKERLKKRCSIPLIIMETQITTTIRYYLLPGRMSSIRKTEKKQINEQR